MISALAFSYAVSFNHAHKPIYADGEKIVSLDEQGEKTAGYGYSATCSIDSLSSLSALNVSVYYDDSIVTVTSMYNNVPCVLYDNSNSNSAVNFSYIFDGNGADENTQLFYFYYQIKDNAPEGNYYFDIIINEAYDSSLNSVPVSGVRCNFHVNAPQQVKSVNIYGSGSINTSKNQEFDVSYTLYDYSILSGSFNIAYDSELFEAVSVTNGGYMANKTVDSNINLAGTVYISFVSTEVTTSSQLFTVRFRTIKNETTSSSITLTAPELYDSELDSVLSNTVQTTISIAYDSRYDESIPKMHVTASCSGDNKTLTALISLDANSHLGAGDFVLSWTGNYLEYASYQKEFNPTYFLVNTNELAQKRIKFSIISMSDIVMETNVISIAFNMDGHNVSDAIEFTLTGNDLTDSLTEPINLNFANCSTPVVFDHKYGDWVITQEPTLTEEGQETRICSVCAHEETRAIPAMTAKEMVEQYLTTKPSLSYKYEKNGNDFVFSDVAIRFSGLISESLWNRLDEESDIQGIGVIRSNQGTTGIKALYNAAKTNEKTVDQALAEICDGTDIKNFYIELEGNEVPDNANAKQKGDLVGDYYIWNLYKVIHLEELKTNYVAVAYIRVNNDIVFFNEVTASVKSIANDLISSGAYNAESIDGSLYYLANLE